MKISVQQHANPIAHITSDIGTSINNQKHAVSSAPVILNPNQSIPHRNAKPTKKPIIAPPFRYHHPLLKMGVFPYLIIVYNRDTVKNMLKKAT